MRNLTNTGKKINSLMGKAINEYDLISEGDRILVAVSGGKDSLTLLTLLKAIQGWAPVKFELVASHVKTDMHCGDLVQIEKLADIFRDMEVEYSFPETKILDEDGRTNCFWCSWNRRKALFETAVANKCNKVALGHHKDDIAETILMNMFYNGEISGMNPFQIMFGGELTIIRPLCNVEERLIKQFAKEMGLEPNPYKCPYGGDSRRQYVKNIIREAEISTPKISIKTNILKSLTRIKEEYIDIRET